MGNTNKAIDILAILGAASGSEGKIGASLRWFDQAITLAVDVGQKTMISNRLVEVLQLAVGEWLRGARPAIRAAARGGGCQGEYQESRTRAQCLTRAGKGRHRHGRSCRAMVGGKKVSLR